jgi:hypothetical protein
MRKVLAFALVALTWFSGTLAVQAATSMGALPCHGNSPAAEHPAAAAAAVVANDHHLHGEPLAASDHDGAGVPGDDRAWRSVCCPTHCLLGALVHEPAPVEFALGSGALLPADTRRSGTRPPPLDRPPIV